MKIYKYEDLLSEIEITPERRARIDAGREQLEREAIAYNWEQARSCRQFCQEHLGSQIKEPVPSTPEIDNLRAVIESMGGHLKIELVAVFGNETITIPTPEVQEAHRISSAQDTLEEAPEDLLPALSSA